jgi:sugar phosphate isomerase/epimerase
MNLVEKLRPRIGLQILFDFKDVVEAIAFAKANGFNVLELNLNNISFLQQLHSSEQRKRIRQVAQKNHITLLIHSPEGLSFFIPDEKVRNIVLDALKQIIDWSKELNVARVTFHLGTDLFFGMSGKKIATYEVFPDYFHKSIAEVLAEIKSFTANKTYACVENVGGFRYPFVLEILDKVLGGRLALTMDIGHIYRFQGEAREKEIAFFKNHLQFIKNCHVHDNNSEWDQHNVIGEGKIDFVPYFQMLADTESYLIFEVRPKESALVCLDRFNSIIAPKLLSQEK